MLKIAFDLDGTCNEYQQYFSLISNALKGKAVIYIITSRDPDDYNDTEKELKELEIYYDHLAITDNKAEYILEEGISVLYEDTDEYFLELPESVAIFMVRNGGNFCFTKKKWVYGDRTGYKI